MPIASSVVCLLLALLPGPARQLIPVPAVNAGNSAHANGTGPYSSFSYVVRIAEANEPREVLGGFSEVTGLKASHKVGDVTLKRGVVNSSNLWNWLNDARKNGDQARRTVVIVLRNEAGNPVQSWKLQNVVPKKYTGPKLGGKSGDVAMEELVLSAETITIVLRR